MVKKSDESSILHRERERKLRGEEFMKEWI